MCRLSEIPNGIPSSSPVAESARLPWVRQVRVFQPQRGCGTVALVVADATPLGVEEDFNQLSSFLATAGLEDGIPLGFGTMKEGLVAMTIP